jgi:putative endonuclease
MNERLHYVYIMANHKNTVLYIGATSDLPGRIFTHRNKLVEGFTKKYNVTKLVYYELCETHETAIIRVQQLKGWLKQRQVDLIAAFNPEWQDLYDKLQ